MDNAGAVMLMLGQRLSSVTCMLVKLPSSKKALPETRR